jgi:Protein of unknown function (DUF2442)
MPRLTEAIARDVACLFVRFDDGTSGEIDLSSRLFGPMFEALRDPVFFARVTVDEYGTPTWPNGADLAPDAIYRQLSAHATKQQPG